MAMEVWGNPLRARLFEFIRDNPGLVFGQIYSGFREEAESITGRTFTAQNFSRHLRIMREIGVLNTNLPENLLKGRSPQYEIDAERSDSMIDAVVMFVDGYRTGRTRP